MCHEPQDSPPISRPLYTSIDDKTDFLYILMADKSKKAYKYIHLVIYEYQIYINHA